MKILDHIWMVVLPGKAGVVYEVGTSARDVWEKIIRGEKLGTGVTRKQLLRQGYVARKVAVCLQEEVS